ncbi:MAG: hypothetical protein ACYDCK_00720 [Thermoplasmatota archaeon]
MSRFTFVLVASMMVAAVFAGCVKPGSPLGGLGANAPVSFADLSAANAKSTVTNVDGTKSFFFEGTSATYADVLIQGTPQTPSLDEKYDVDSRVGYVEANITYDASSGTNVYAQLVDDQGRIQCGTGLVVPHDCTAPVPSNTSGKIQWRIQVVTGYPTGPTPAEPAGLPYKVAVTLHPVSHITRGDPLAGVDGNISFFVSDTKVRGSEPNIGVLGDGAIFAQEGLKTMMSKDDGKTWKDVAPVTTSKQSFDPMLYADPYTNTVYVDQLYIGCSILAWSSDEGANWVTNPAGFRATITKRSEAARRRSPARRFPRSTTRSARSRKACGSRTATTAARRSSPRRWSASPTAAATTTRATSSPTRRGTSSTRSTCATRAATWASACRMTTARRSPS